MQLLRVGVVSVTRVHTAWINDEASRPPGTSCVTIQPENKHLRNPLAVRQPFLGDLQGFPAGIFRCVDYCHYCDAHETWKTCLVIPLEVGQVQRHAENCSPHWIRRRRLHNCCHGLRGSDSLCHYGVYNKDVRLFMHERLQTS